MTSQAKKLLEEALKLSQAEREVLAGQLFESLDQDDPDAELTWQTEIEKRICEMDQAKVSMIPWSEAKRKIFGDMDESVRD